MVSITLSIPEEIKEKMSSFPEVNWSGFVREAIIKKTEELSWKEEMLEKLEKEEEFTEWAIKASKEFRSGRYAELKKKGLI